MHYVDKYLHVDKIEIVDSDSNDYYILSTIEYNVLTYLSTQCTLLIFYVIFFGAFLFQEGERFRTQK